MEVIFTNTENSKNLTANTLNLEYPNKNMTLAKLSIFIHGKILNMHIATLNQNLCSNLK